MPKGKNLGDLEQLVILAVMRLGEGAYGMIVRREIEANSGRRVSFGAIYATLDRLESKGFVSSVVGETTAARRGRAKRYFRVQALGVRALEEALADLDRMRRGVAGMDHPLGAEA